MKFNIAVALLSAMICSAGSLDYEEISNKCFRNIENPKFFWDAGRVKPCLRAFVETDKDHLLDYILADIVPGQLNPVDRRDVNQHVIKLLVTASLDEHIDSLYHLAHNVMYRYIPEETCRNGFLKAAGSRSPKVVDFWIERMLGVPLLTDQNEQEFDTAWLSVFANKKKLPSALSKEAINVAWKSGDAKMTRKLINSPYLTVDDDDHDIKNIKRFSAVNG